MPFICTIMPKLGTFLYPICNYIANMLKYWYGSNKCKRKAYIRKGGKQMGIILWAGFKKIL